MLQRKAESKKYCKGFEIYKWNFYMLRENKTKFHMVQNLRQDRVKVKVYGDL